MIPTYNAAVSRMSSAIRPIATASIHLSSRRAASDSAMSRPAQISWKLASSPCTNAISPPHSKAIAIRRGGVRAKAGCSRRYQASSTPAVSA